MSRAEQDLDEVLALSEGILQGDFSHDMKLAAHDLKRAIMKLQIVIMQEAMNKQ
jgi:hypothetical protein